VPSVWLTASVGHSDDESIRDGTYRANTLFHTDTIMKGGDSIGSGTDGCVFNVRFDATGNVVPESKDGALGIATKIYSVGPKEKSMNPAAVNEYEMMMKVRKVTNGLGVAVALDGTLRQLENIDKSEIDTIPLLANGTIQGACAYMKDKTKSPYTLIELPLVSGSITRFSFGVLAEDEFANLKSALEKMKAAQLTQLDLAARNVFYSAEEGGKAMLLLGDFGNGIDLSSPPDRRFLDMARLVRRYNAYPHTVIYRDGFHYRGYLYMIAAVFLGLASRKPTLEDGDKLWTEVRGRFTQLRDVLDKLKDNGNWRILRAIDMIAPKPIVDSLPTESVLQAEYEKLGEVEGAAATTSEAPPPAAAAAASQSVPPVPGGEVPESDDLWAVSIDEELKKYEKYVSERDTFINGYMAGIKATCDEILAIPFDTKENATNVTSFETLLKTASEAILASDGYMYELIHAIYGEGEIGDRLKRLNTAWGYSEPEKKEGGARRRTYRRKRVKMSRRK
jgi:hypothetical protein